MRSTMQDDYQLTVGSLMRHGTHVYGDSEVITATAEASRTQSYAELGVQAARLAGGLRSLGIDADQRVATFQWNNAEHLAAYLAVPAMGAVLHTLNLRLPPSDLAYIANHAQDSVVIVDDSLVDTLSTALGDMDTVTHVIVAGPGAAAANLESLRATGKQVVLYDELLQNQPDQFDWPDIDERAAACMCYTSGTTGRPKGIVYSHRSVYLHAMAVTSGNATALTFNDRTLAIVPMFHVNAWGIPYASMLSGASQCLPDRFMDAASMVRFIQNARPTVSNAVPTIWFGILDFLDHHPDISLDSLRLILVGGSAAPISLQKALWDRHQLEMRHAWGMTETSPVASVAIAPANASRDEQWRYRATQGRMLGGMEARLCDDAGNTLPEDGHAVGELEVRGPWVAGSYYKQEGSSDQFHDGWLRTGDVGVIDERGFLSLTDRVKDVIKSGGEWISSVHLENALMAHEAVAEAAVIAIPDEKWQERPLATVVLADGQHATIQELRDFLSTQFAKWQLPDAWVFVDQVPRTSVGKFDKKALRSQYTRGELHVERRSG